MWGKTIEEKEEWDRLFKEEERLRAENEKGEGKGSGQKGELKGKGDSEGKGKGGKEGSGGLGKGGKRENWGVAAGAKGTMLSKGPVATEYAGYHSIPIPKMVGIRGDGKSEDQKGDGKGNQAEVEELRKELEEFRRREEKRIGKREEITLGVTERTEASIVIMRLAGHLYSEDEEEEVWIKGERRKGLVFTGKEI